MTGHRLPLRTRLGYGLGDLGFNLYFTTASLYLLLYYTDVLGLPPATGGWIFAAALIWDAITDPVMGYVASRTRSRWGRYRPYLLFGAVPLAASWALMFLPTGFEGTALTLFALAAHMLFRTLYTVVSMPYLSLSAAITSDSHERGVLAGFRMVGATAGGLLIAFFTLRLVDWLGSGDAMRGFLYVALLFGVIGTLLHWNAFAATQERATADAQIAPSAREMMRMLRLNRAFWLVGGTMLMASMAGTFFGKALPYFFKYDVGREDLIGTALAMVTGFAMLSIPLWTHFMRRTSKRTVSLCGSLLGVVAYTAFALVPSSEVAVLLAVLAVAGVAGGAGYLTFWAMMPDTVEFGEWRSGIRAEGMVFGFVSFIQKAALGLGVGLLGEVLSAIGYIANQPQEASTLQNLRLIMFAAPLTFALAAATFIWFYPLDRKRHDRIVRALAWRKARGSSVSGGG